MAVGRKVGNVRRVHGRQRAGAGSRQCSFIAIIIKGCRMVGFTGSRSLSGKFKSLVTLVVSSFANQQITVGCAQGADQFVRSTAPSCNVFYASSYLGPPAARLAQRSAALVRTVAASAHPLIIGFVTGPCPTGLQPAPQPSLCFAGFGSGTWAALALAAGLGVPVIAYWCANQPVNLPLTWGQWQPCTSAGHTGYCLQPAAVQLSLF